MLKRSCLSALRPIECLCTSDFCFCEALISSPLLKVNSSVLNAVSRCFARLCAQFLRLTTTTHLSICAPFGMPKPESQCSKIYCSTGDCNGSPAQRPKRQKRRQPATDLVDQEILGKHSCNVWIELETSFAPQKNLVHCKNPAFIPPFQPG